MECSAPALRPRKGEKMSKLIVGEKVVHDGREYFEHKIINDKGTPILGDYLHPAVAMSPGTYALIPDTHVAMSKGAVRQLRALANDYREGILAWSDKDIDALLAKLPEVGE